MPEAQGQQGQQAAAQQQHDPQALQAAAQLGQEMQRAGVDGATLFRVVGLLQRYGPTIAQIAQELGGLFGGGQAGQAPAGQAQAK